MGPGPVAEGHRAVPQRLPGFGGAGLGGARRFRDHAPGVAGVDLRRRGPHSVLGTGAGSGRGGLLPGAAALGAGLVDLRPGDARRAAAPGAGPGPHAPRDMVVGVVYREQALPVAWHIVEAQARGSWVAHFGRLLRLLAPAVPPGTPVHVLCDQGLGSRKLWRQIVDWHPVLRYPPHITTGGERVPARQRGHAQRARPSGATPCRAGSGALAAADRHPDRRGRGLPPDRASGAASGAAQSRARGPAPAGPGRGHLAGRRLRHPPRGRPRPRPAAGPSASPPGRGPTGGGPAPLQPAAACNRLWARVWLTPTRPRPGRRPALPVAPRRLSAPRSRPRTPGLVPPLPGFRDFRSRTPAPRAGSRRPPVSKQHPIGTSRRDRNSRLFHPGSSRLPSVPPGGMGHGVRLSIPASYPRGVPIKQPGFRTTQPLSWNPDTPLPPPEPASCRSIPNTSRGRAPCTPCCCHCSFC